jgi:predicted anti-sigma-YlaC factor YlaD
MRCAEGREGLSARLDGEDPDSDPAVLEGHLAICAECRDWLDAAQRVHRRVRITPAAPVPDRTDELVAAVLRDRRRRAGGARLHTSPLRLALMIVAGLQLALSIPELLGGILDHGGGAHHARELGSFGLALAVGFAAAALRPARAQGAIPLVGVVALALAGTAFADVVQGHTAVASELPHLLPAAGWLLLLALVRSDRGEPGSPEAAPAAGARIRRWSARWGSRLAPPWGSSGHAHMRTRARPAVSRRRAA